MGYKVIHAFSDMQDFHHIYSVGDIFPRTGLKVSEERIKELAGKNNKQGQSLIAKTEDDSTRNVKPEEECELPFVEVPQTSAYTKTQINRMPTADLKQLASSIGIENADEMTGAELKKQLINAFGL